MLRCHDAEGGCDEGRRIVSNRRLPPEGRDLSLEEALQELSRGLRTGGADEDSLLREEAFQQLVSWAEGHERFYEGLMPEAKGGREHDLTFEPQTRTWLKFTNPSIAGYIIDPEEPPPELASTRAPLAYLNLLSWRSMSPK